MPAIQRLGALSPVPSTASTLSSTANARHQLRGTMDAIGKHQEEATNALLVFLQGQEQRQAQRDQERMERENAHQLKILKHEERMELRRMEHDEKQQANLMLMIQALNKNTSLYSTLNKVLI